MAAWVKPLFLLLGGAAALAAGQIWTSHLRYELSLENQRVEQERQQALKETSTLRLELANLTRPERLRKIAQEEFGMGPPKPMQVVHQ